MQLQVIASGSNGNCYALYANGEILLLDAGIAVKRIMKAIHYRSRDVVGCLVTHEHSDHFFGAVKLAESGIPCYGSSGASMKMGTIKRLDKGKIGSFMVRSVPVLHDAVEPCGWLIRNSKTGETMLYATDTYWLPNSYPGLHYWLIECNYCEDLIMDEAIKKRLLTTHMSLDNLCKLLKLNDLSQCKKIVLCHISNLRGDYERMRSTVQKTTGIPVDIAQAGVTIPLELAPF